METCVDSVQKVSIVVDDLSFLLNCQKKDAIKVLTDTYDGTYSRSPHEALAMDINYAIGASETTPQQRPIWTFWVRTTNDDQPRQQRRLR